MFSNLKRKIYIFFEEKNESPKVQKSYYGLNKRTILIIYPQVIVTEGSEIIS